MNSFPKSARLIKRWEFRRRACAKRFSKYLIVDLIPSEVNRLGLVVSRRYGKACVRNRFKRLVREAYRCTRAPSGFDLIVRPRKSACSATASQIKDDLVSLYQSKT